MELWLYKREKEIKEFLDKEDIELVLTEDYTLTPIDAVLTDNGTPYSKYTPYRKPSIDRDTFHYYTNVDFKKHDRLRNRPTNITDEQLNNCKNNVIDQLLKHTAEMYKPVVCNSQYYQDNSKKCIDLNEIEIVTFKI